MLTIRYALCAIFALVGLHASAGVMNQGDFIQFDKEGVLVQAIDIPANALKLSFDFAFSTDATSGIFPGFEDSFAAVLETVPDADVLDIFVVDVFSLRLEPSDELALLFPSFYPGLVQIDVDYDDTVSIPGFQEFAAGTSFSGRISLALPGEVLGESATLTFRMLNPNTTVESLAALDNVSVTTSNAAIPEPSSFALWLGVTSLLVFPNRRRRRDLHLPETFDN